MKRFILNLGAMTVLFGAMSSPLLAAPHGGHGGGHGGGHPSGHAGHVAAYHGLHHGPGGYLLRDFRGWGRIYWNARYRCNWYFCPTAGCYYYWYAPDACYLPESQASMYPPTVDMNNGGYPQMPALPMPPPQ